MSRIKKVEFERKTKIDLRYDSAIGKYIGHQIDIRVGKKRHRDTFSTRKKAEDFISDLQTQQKYRKAGLKSPVQTTVMLKTLFTKRLSKITNAKEIIRATRVFREFELTFDRPPQVTEVRSVHFQKYINHRLDAGVKPETANREITILSTAFKQAAELFPEALENYEPPRMIRPRFKKGKRRQRIITEKEKDVIVASIINGHLKKERPQRRSSRETAAIMFEIAWMLGLRFSEVKRLLKTDFNAATKTLRVVRWKTGTVTLMEFLPDRVIELLGQSVSATDFIFDLKCSDHTFAAIIRDACQDNGITYGRGEIDGVTFHSTRHSFITRLMEVADLATTQEFSAHSDASMVAYYSHSSPEKKRAAMEKMYGANKADTGLLLQVFTSIKNGEMSFAEFVEYYTFGQKADRFAKQ